MPGAAAADDPDDFEGTPLNTIIPPFHQVHWDIDTIMLKSLPGFTHLLSHIWEVATSPAPANSEAPPGLCITSKPFFTILTLPGCNDPAGNPEAQETLTSMAALLRALLRDLSLVNNPVLVPRAPHQSPWKSLARCGACRILGSTLSDALLQLSQDFQFEVWHFSYGLKLSADAIFPLVENLHHAIASEHGVEVVEGLRASSYLDWGTEPLAGGGVVLVKPNQWMKDMGIHWPGCRVTSYPSFPGLGHGFGGFTLLCPNEGQELKRVCLYPGGWKHSLFRLFSPVLVAPKGATQRWYYKAKAPLEEALATLGEWSDPMGGFRLEVRGTPPASWDEAHAFLWASLSHLLPHCLGHEVSKGDILRVAQAAMEASITAGLFSMAGGEGQVAPPWRRAMYHRLLASFGYSHKYWAKWATRVASQPWLPPANPPPPPPANLPPARGPRPPMDGEPLAPGLLPGEVGNLSQDALEPEELAVLAKLPTKRARNGGFCIYFKPPWGGLGPLPRSKAYKSLPALARALWQWAGVEWEERVRV